MKNKISDLANYLFGQIERLDDEELTDEQLEMEIKRSDALCKVAGQITDIAALSLKAARMKAESDIDVPLLEEK